MFTINKAFFSFNGKSKRPFFAGSIAFFFVLFFNVKSKKVTFAGSDYVHHQ